MSVGTLCHLGADRRRPSTAPAENLTVVYQLVANDVVLSWPFLAAATVRPANDPYVRFGADGVDAVARGGHPAWP